MLMNRQNRIHYVWGGGLLKELLNRFSLFLCTSCIILSFAFHHFYDPSYIHPNCLWFSFLTLFHFYSTEIYFTYTNYCVWFLLIIDFPSFYLPVSYLLIQFMHRHYCHQRMLIIEKRGFLSIMSLSGFSKPRARAGKQSVTRLMKRRWTGLRIVKPRSDEVKIARTSERFEPRRNWIAFLMLS